MGTIFYLVALSSCLAVTANYQYLDSTVQIDSSEFENITRFFDGDQPKSHILEGPSLDVPTDSEMAMVRAVSDMLYSNVEDLLKGPLDTVKEINTVGLEGIKSNVHEKISYLYVKLFTYFIRAYVYTSRALLSSYKTIRGHNCYKVPDIEKFYKIFTLFGGEICPFDDFEMQNVTVKDSVDGNWIVELPLVFRKVKTVFASVQVYTSYLSTPAWTFEAKDVSVKLSLGLAKSLIPYPNSIDLKVKVDGCDISDPNSNWIISKLMKMSSKICDPILNEIIKLALYTTRMELKMIAWFAKTVFKGDMWMYTMIEWVLKQLQQLLKRKADFTS